MVLEENLERFAGDLAVEEEIVVAGYEKDGGGAGLEVLYVAPLNGALATIVLDGKRIVVYLNDMVSHVNVR